MRIKIIILLVIILLFGCVSHVNKSTIKNAHNTTILKENKTFFSNLTEIVKEAPYNTSDYVPNKFDCSNMASLMYDWLKLHGYHNVKIVIGLSTTWRGHVWILLGNLTFKTHLCTKEFCVHYLYPSEYNKTIQGYFIEGSDWHDYVSLSNNSVFVEPTTKTIIHNIPSYYYINMYQVYVLKDWRYACYYTGFWFRNCAIEFGYNKKLY